MKKLKSLRELYPKIEKRELVYIAGKVTGLPYDETVEKFSVRSAELKAMGYMVFNPMEVVDPSCEWRDAMKICLSFLPHCDYIDLLPDWTFSKGALWEYKTARKLGIGVFKS